VAGVYDKDPKVAKDAKLIEELSLAKVMELSASQNAADASGAMHGKLMNLEGVRAEMEKGLCTNIISMMEPGNLKGLLNGEEYQGTRICP
jgi:uridylate kinase